ncbi:isoprenylcysteine carboxylmethyltransferase family protein [Epibacterium sp. SM1969]|uniref:Isoprenylcysteine carboxylmethyltransferase family protein n=2 Tax=Tritonibacter aquimaris TaxID=2663379 RepID=A0A844ARS7_9RHOB|nr:isoprenylcysteine carboxylmethyltransferase family protein [Tritonibacter aquimaris]
MCAIVWTQAKFLPMGPRNAIWFPTGLVWLVWGTAAALVAAALWQMWRHRTTVHPHDMASKLVTSGAFGISRNPIYVADVLVLVGVVLRFGTVVSTLCVGVFIWVLQRRFILAEELRLKSQFPALWTEYKNKTRRWI